MAYLARVVAKAVKTSGKIFSRCGWPVALQVPVEPSWRSGFYVIVVRVLDDDGGGAVNASISS